MTATVMLSLPPRGHGDVGERPSHGSRRRAVGSASIELSSSGIVGM